jgi:hypothetical protein
MAKLTLTDLASLQNETSVITTINNNNDAIEQAMEKTLTRDGTSPNSLSAQLDMNTNKIINLAKGTTTGEALEYSQLQEKVDDINTIYNQAVTAKNQAQAAQSGAELAESNAEAAEAQAEDILLEIQTIFDTYNNQFLGTFTSDPTVDNDGNPLTVGDIYYNSIFLSMRVWDGAAWQDIAAMTPTSHNEISNKVYINPVFRGTFLPETSDGVALGSSSYMFSDLFLAAGAVINFNASNVTITHNTNSLAFAGASSGYSFDARISRDSQFFMDMTTAPYINWDNNDYISYDRGSNLYNFVIGSTVEAVLSGTELRPGSNDGSALGTTSSSWADLFLASGAVINFANGNYTLTHSSGLLNFSGSGQFGNTLFVSGGYSGAYSGGSSALKFGGGGSNPNAAAIGWGDGSGWILNLGYNSSSVFTPRYQFVDNGAFRPATSDAAVLGDTTHMWSDLFLASGGVVNFNNGDFTLTHSSGILTANKDFRVTTAGTNSTSVATVGGTQTLTNKTINLTNNTLSGTTTQFNTALNDDDFATLTNSVTLTNKTLTSPVIGTIVNTGTLTLPTATSTILSSTGNVNLTGGFTATSFSGGTITSGTYTPSALSGGLQHITANGAFILGIPAAASTIVLEVTNGASAGSITTSAYTKVTGDGYVTTNAFKFLFFITKTNSYSHLHIQALQ